jgi:hypothetical protein
VVVRKRAKLAMSDLLNHQFSLGEVILTFFMAIPAALIVHPILKLLAKLWTKCLDMVAASFESIRVLQIRSLEFKLRKLKLDEENFGRVIIKVISDGVFTIVTFVMG